MYIDDLECGVYSIDDTVTGANECYAIVDDNAIKAYRVVWYGDLGDYERYLVWEGELDSFVTVDELLNEFYASSCNRDNLEMKFVGEWDAGFPEEDEVLGDDDELIAFVLEACDKR